MSVSKSIQEVLGRALRETGAHLKRQGNVEVRLLMIVLAFLLFLLNVAYQLKSFFSVDYLICFMTISGRFFHAIVLK
jgi:hypothetical protein